MAMRTLRCFSAVLALLAVVFVRPVSADTAPLTDRQMVHESEHIVVAVVEDSRARWNPQHTLIFTDYELRIEDRLKGSAPSRITLSLPGGTLDGETHGTSLATSLERGGRYLLFLGDFTRPSLEMVIGAQKGVFREVATPQGKRLTSPGGSAPPLAVNGTPVEFKDFVAAIRSLVTRVSAHPEPTDTPVKATNRQALPAKDYDPDAPAAKGGSTAAPVREPADVPPPPWTNRAEAGTILDAQFAADGLDQIWDAYVYRNRPPAPIVVDNFPRGFSFAPSDQHQMAYWNVYAKDLFRVKTIPSNTWRFGNGVFDLAGFPSNSQMNQQFGAPWGSNTLGVTYYRVVNNTIIEADIALNPAFSWTADDRVATRPGSVYSFKDTVLHELGHAWGLAHPWETQDVWWDSVMNYAPKEYRLARLLADDSTAARTAYPGISIRDGGLSPHSTADRSSNNNPSYIRVSVSPTRVQAGKRFTVINPIVLANTGTVNLVNPVVEVYLVPQRFSFSGSRFITSLRYSFTAQTFSTNRLNLGSLTVPRSVPPGIYYLAFFLRDSADKFQNNNGTWSNHNVTLQVTR